MTAVASGRLVRAGRWLVLDPSWSPSSPADQWRHELYSVFCACSPRHRAGVLVFRRAAAGLWGFDGVAPGAVELATCSGHPGIASVSRVRLIYQDERAHLAGLPVTSVTRTLLDLGQSVDGRVIERALEWVLRKGRASLPELRAAVDRAPAQRGTRALRELLALRPADLRPTESDAETLFVQLAREVGLPEPQRQFAVPTTEGLFRLDFAWPTRRLAVEIDGAATHASAVALGRDLRRQNRVLLSLGSAGWMLLRFTWDDLTSPRYVGRVAGVLREAWAIGLNSGR